MNPSLLWESFTFMEVVEVSLLRLPTPAEKLCCVDLVLVLQILLTCLVIPSQYVALALRRVYTYYYYYTCVSYIVLFFQVHNCHTKQKKKWCQSELPIGKGLSKLTISIKVQATSGAGKVAELAEVKKDQKYSLLGTTYLFTPVAIETSGAIGPRSRVFLRELGRRVRWESGEPRATSYLLQRL